MFTGWLRRVIAILLVLGSIGFENVNSSRAFAQVAPVTLGATLIALQELKQALQSTINTVDPETSAKINQLSIAVDSAIKEVQSAIDDASHQIQFDENKLFSDVFSVMSEVNDELDRKGYLAFIGVNATLANVATTMEGVPGLKIAPFLFATYPLRLSRSFFLPDASSV